MEDFNRLYERAHDLEYENFIQRIKDVQLPYYFDEDDYPIVATNTDIPFNLEVEKIDEHGNICGHDTQDSFTDYCLDPFREIMPWHLCEITYNIK